MTMSDQVNPAKPVIKPRPGAMVVPQLKYHGVRPNLANFPEGRVDFGLEIDESASKPLWPTVVLLDPFESLVLVRFEDQLPIHQLFKTFLLDLSNFAEEEATVGILEGTDLEKAYITLVTCSLQEAAIITFSLAPGEDRAKVELEVCGRSVKGELSAVDTFKYFIRF